METPSDSSIIKSGRTRYTAQYKREVLDAFKSSSLSAPAIVMLCGVKYPTCAAWITGRRQGSLPRPASRRSEVPAFLRVEIGDAQPGEAVEVRLLGGRVARAAGPYLLKLLAELLCQLA